MNSMSYGSNSKVARNGSCKYTYGRCVARFSELGWHTAVCLDKRPCRSNIKPQNLVSFNANKTQCGLISRSENKNLPDILCGSNTPKMCDSLSMLDVSVASDLSWNEHISSVAKSAASKMASYSGPSDFSRPCIISPSTRPKSAPVSNTALICGEEPPNIPSLA